MATVGYSIFLAVGFLFPFDLTADRSLAEARLEAFLARLPFLALYLGNEFNAIKQALVRILLFVPVGGHVGVHRELLLEAASSIDW